MYFLRKPETGAAFVSPLQGLGNVILTPHIAGEYGRGAAEYRAVCFHANVAVFAYGKFFAQCESGRNVIWSMSPGSHRPDAYPSQCAGHFCGRSTIFWRIRKSILSGRFLDTRGNLGYAIYDINRQLRRGVDAAVAGGAEYDPSAVGGGVPGVVLPPKAKSHKKSWR